MTILKEALKYLEKGYSLIPINPYTKKSFFEWKQYQDKKTTVEEVKKWWSEFPTAMIGIITGKINNLFVLDLDVDHDEKINDYLPESIITPTSSTPRGGKHLYFQDIGDSRITVKANLLFKVDYRCNGGYIIAPPSVNGYKRKYQWLDGLSLFDIEPAAAPSPLIDFIINSASSSRSLNTSILNTIAYNIEESLQNVTNVTNRNIFFKEGTRDNDLFTVANALIKSKVNENMVSQVIEILALNCDPPFPLEEAREKISSAIARAKRKERNLTQEIRDWLSVTSRNISVTLALQELQSVTSADRAKVRVIFKRLCEEGLIERVGDMDGWYRRVESNIEEMKWWEASGKEIQMQWPFGIENYYRALSKNIIVIAGTSDAGKTAFLLNYCLQNISKDNIYYFNSEGSEDELLDRLSNFNIPNFIEKFKKVRFFSRSREFQDLIKPNDINIIDYMDVPEEPWKIGISINKIHDKLDKGICIIALQKPRLRDIARGGEITLDKPRLYLSIGKDESGDNLLKIIKCKNWRDRNKNPNGLQLRFKIVAGCHLIQTSDWQKP